MIDTPKLARKMRDGGMETAQGDALSQAFAAGLGERAAAAAGIDLSTADLELVEAWLRGELQTLCSMPGVVIAGIFAIAALVFAA